MGLLFNRGQTGLAPGGSPMLMEELALLLSQMPGGTGGAGSGVANMMRNMYIKKAMKNRAGAREALTKSGVAGGANARGGPSMLTPMQKLQEEVGDVATRFNAGGGPGGAAPAAPFPQTPPGTASPSMPPPVKAGGQITPSPSSSGGGAISGSPAELVADFYNATPQKVKAIQDMILSGDNKMREIGQGWLTALASGPKPQDYYLAVGGSVYNILTGEWSRPKQPPGIKNVHLPEGVNLLTVTNENGVAKTVTVEVPPDANWQIKETLWTRDPQTGEELSIYSRIDTETGLAEPIRDKNGEVVFAGANVELTGQKTPPGAVTKWWDQYSAAKLSLHQLEDLRNYKDDIMKALTIGGKLELAWGNIMSRLGIEPDAEFDKLTSGVAKAQHVANLYIKTITGAQMSEREAKRLLLAIPNPKDSPARWAAKLEAAIEIAQISMQHYEELLNKYGEQNIERVVNESHAFSKHLVDEFERKNREEEGYGGGVEVL